MSVAATPISPDVDSCWDSTFTPCSASSPLMVASTPGTLRCTWISRCAPARSARARLGQVDTQRGAAQPDVVAQLARDEPTDVLLGLLRAAADVRGQDDVRQPAEFGHEGLAALLRFHREYVDRRAGERAGDDPVPQRTMVDDEPAGEVEEQGARLHQVELGGAEHALVAGPAVHVQRDDVGHGQQLRQAAAALRRSER